MITMEQRKDLTWAMKMVLVERANVLQEGAEVKDFVLNEATYEQMLNLVFNEQRDDVYKSAEVLESQAIEFVENAFSPTTSTDKYTVLEQVLNEEDAVKYSLKKAAGGEIKRDAAAVAAGAKRAGSAVKRGASKVGKAAKAAGSKIKAGAAAAGAKVKAGAARVGSTKAGTFVKDTGAALKQTVKNNPVKYAAGAAAVGAGLYYLYRQMRKRGASKKQAAAAVASKAKTPAQKAKWTKMANEAAK